ncbi:MAG: guanylate kinase [Gemmatimonadetes bacterium]|nr:MAG: guanylate kinase [Gemmatimonadota bacterium]
MSGLPARTFPVVLAAPSGTGKTTIARALVERFEHFVFSVSVTTRPPREGERDGIDYRFVDEAEFKRLRDGGALVEWAEVHGHLYGTPGRALEEAAEAGRHVVLDIDVQGARQVRERVPEAVLVFVFPPSAQALVGRLRGRGTESDEVMRRRLRAARQELRRATDFDYIVVNDDLESAIADVVAITRAECHRPRRARGLETEVVRLQTEIDGVLGEG